MEITVWGYGHLPTQSAMKELGASKRERYNGVPDIACTPGKNVVLVIAEHQTMPLGEAAKLCKLKSVMLFERHDGKWASFKVSPA